MIGVNPNLHQEDMSLPQCSEDCHVGAVALSDLWHLWCINFVHSENKQTLLPGYYERFHIWKWNSPWKISIQDDSQHLRKPVKWIMQHVFRQPFYGCFLRSTTDRYLVWFLDISMIPKWPTGWVRFSYLKTLAVRFVLWWFFWCLKRPCLRKNGCKIPRCWGAKLAIPIFCHQ